MSVGALTVIYGPMFAGKSSELLRLAVRSKLAKRTPILVKSKLDDRYGVEEKIITHSGEGMEAYAARTADDILFHILANFEPATFSVLDVFIDEAQFFELEPFISVVQTLIDKGINVFVAGLNTDFKNEPWPTMAQIIALADEVVRLKAVCAVCGQDATRTQRLINGQPAKRTDPVVLVGALDVYEARCRECHEVL